MKKSILTRRAALAALLGGLFFALWIHDCRESDKEWAEDAAYERSGITQQAVSR